jgi:hypothetical protein
VRACERRGARRKNPHDTRDCPRSRCSHAMSGGSAITLPMGPDDYGLKESQVP